MQTSDKRLEIDFFFRFNYLFMQCISCGAESWFFDVFAARGRRKLRYDQSERNIERVIKRTFATAETELKGFWNPSQG